MAPPEKVAVMPSNIDVDRNLLFAVIALQDDLIDQTQFADVCAGWAVRLERPLPELLDRAGLDHGAGPERRRAKARAEAEETPGRRPCHSGRGGRDRGEGRLAGDQKPAGRVSHLSGLSPARGHVLVETLVPRATQRDSLRYTLTRLHAEGGLGKIWVAHDTDLNRDVALKEIKPTATPSPESWRRFLKEAQITGQLEHPNIVPVYELARRKEDDQPFYTMRFVRGQSLRDAIAEFHRRRAGKPAERLELQRQLLEPFIKVCQAVGYAHSRGVIHRDLKPENVVLGGHGEVVVLDWGLAKVVGQPDADRPEAREPRISVSAEAEATQDPGPARHARLHGPGTGRCASPAWSIPGPTSTAWAAILFEILTGSSAGCREQRSAKSSARSSRETCRRRASSSRPFRGRSRPFAPRRWRMTASNRYRRPEDLAEDVRRWLVDEPVSVYHDPLARPAVALEPAASHAGRQPGRPPGDRRDRPVGRRRARRPRASHRTEDRRDSARSRDNRAERRSPSPTRRRPCTTSGWLRMPPMACSARWPMSILPIFPRWSPCASGFWRRREPGYQQFLVQKGDDPLVRWGADRSLVRLGDIQALDGRRTQGGILVSPGRSRDSTS